MENIIIHRLDDTLGTDSSANTVIKWLTDISSSFGSLSSLKFPLGSPSINMNDASGVIQVTSIDSTNATWYYYISGENAENKKQIVSGDERYLYSSTNSFYATLSGGTTNKSTHIKFRYGIPNGGNDPIFSQNEIMIKQSFIDGTIAGTKLADISNSTTDSYHFASIQDDSNITMTVQEFCLRYLSNTTYINPYAKYKLTSNALDVSDFGIMIRCDTISPTSSISGLQYATADLPSAFIDVSYIADPFNTTACGLLLDSAATLRFNGQQTNPLYSFKFQLWNQYDLTPYTLTRQYDVEALFSQDEFLLPVIIKTYITPTRALSLTDPYYRFTSGVQSRGQGFTVNTLWSASGLSATKSTWGSQYIIVTQQNADISGSTAVWRVNRETWLNDVSSTQIFDLSTTSLTNAIERGYRTTAILQGTDRIYLDIPDGGYTDNDTTAFPSLAFRIYDGRIGTEAAYSIGSDVFTSVRVNIPPTVTSTARELFIVCPTTDKLDSISTADIFRIYGGEDKNKDILKITITDISFGPILYTYTGGSIDNTIDISTGVSIITEYISGLTQYTTTNNTSSYPYLKFKFVDDYGGSSAELTGYVRIQAPPQFSLTDISSQRLRTIYNSTDLTTGASSGDQIYNISGLLSRFFPNRTDSNGLADICGIYIEDISASAGFTVIRRVGESATSGTSIIRTDPNDVNRFCYMNDSVEFNYTGGASNIETITVGFRLFDSNIVNISGVTSPGQGNSALSAQKNTFIINSSNKQSISISGNIIYGELPTTVLNLFENISNTTYNPPSFSVAQLAARANVSLSGIILDGSATYIYNIEGDNSFASENRVSYNGFGEDLLQNGLGKWQYSKSAIDISWIDISATGDRGLLLLSDALLRFNGSSGAIATLSILQPYINFRPYTGSTDISMTTGDKLLDELYWSNTYKNTIRPYIGPTPDPDIIRSYSSITPNSIARIRALIQPLLINETVNFTPNYEYVSHTDTLSTLYIINNSFPKTYTQQLYFTDSLLTNIGTTDCSLNISGNIRGSYISSCILRHRNISGNIFKNNYTISGSALSINYKPTLEYFIRNIEINTQSILSYSQPSIIFDFSGQYKIRNIFDISYQADLLPTDQYYSDISVNLGGIRYNIQKSDFSKTFSFIDLFNATFPDLSDQRDKYGIALYYEPPKYNAEGDPDICGTWIIKQSGFADISQINVLNTPTKYLLIGRDPSPLGTSDSSPINIQFSPIDPPVLENNFTANFKFRLWNRKVGAHGQVFDTSYNSGEERVGPGTPFSADLFTSYCIVTVNSRPTLVAPSYPLKLTNQYEDQPDHTIPIYDISSIYAQILSYGGISISISDDDFGTNAYTQMGMVITDISSKNIGTWEYYRDGESVEPIPTISGNFFHLRLNDRIRFNNTTVPNANNKNDENNSPYFTFRLWDQGNITTVISSGYITDSIRFDDPADNYSQNYITIRINVIPTNDIPIGDLTGGAVTMTTISSSNTDPSGITIQEMFGKFTTISDVDVSGTSSLGIAVYNVDVSYGEWQYKMTTGDSWTELYDIYTLSGAFLLGPDAALRFRSQVGQKQVKQGTLHFRIWDGTLGVSGQTYNVRQFFNDADEAILDSSYNQPPFSKQLYNLNQPVDFINTRPTISLKLPDPDAPSSLDLTSVNIAEGGQLQINCKELISYLNISDIDILDGQYIGLACYAIDVCGADPSLDSTSIKVSYVKNDNITSIPLRDKTQPDLSDLSINNAFHFRCDETLADNTPNNSYILFEGSGSYFYGNIYMKFYSWDGYPLDIGQPNNGPSLFEKKAAITLSGGHPELSSYSINDAELLWGIDPVQNRPEISGTNTSYVFETLQTASPIDLSYIPIVNIINYFINNGTYIERDPDDNRGISITSYSTLLVKKSNGVSSEGIGIWQYTEDYTAESQIWNDIQTGSQTIYYNYLLTRDISAAIRFFPYKNQNEYDAYSYGTSELVMRLYDGTDISMIDRVLTPTESPYVPLETGGSAFSDSNVFINAIIHPVNHAPDLSFTTSAYTIKTYQADTSGDVIFMADIFGVLDAQGAYIESYDLCANFIKRGLYFYNFTNNISGQWYYSDTSGTSWSNAAASYHVPEASDNVRFRFEPAQYKFGDTAGSFSIYAWDTLSTLPDPTSVARGEGTSYSVSGATFSTQVTFMNHSPIIAESSPQDGSVQFTYNITDICEGSGPITISCSNIINALSLSTNYKEYDANQVLGIAIINKYDTSVNAYPSISGLGSWTYNTSGGSFGPLSTRYQAGDVTRYKLINLDVSASIRYTPNTNANGRTTLQFLAWDKNTSNNLFSDDYILNDLSGFDPLRQGGNNSYSINRGEIVLNILPVNTPAYFNLTDISYNAGTFPRGGDLSFVSVSGLITSFGFTDTDSTEYGALAKRSLIVADLCNNLAIGGSWLGVSGDINGPSYEIINGSVLNESDWIFYRSAAIVPTFPAANNRGVSIFLAPYDGGAIIDICYSKTAFVYASITNVQPTISGDPLIYDLSSFIRLTTAPRFIVSDIYNYLYANSSIIKFAGDISSIGIAFSDVSNSENVLKLATGINTIDRTQICNVFIDKWEYKKPTDNSSNRFNINKDVLTGNETYNGGLYYNHIYLTQATEIFMTTPPTIPVTYTNITRNLYCYIYDICDSVPSFSDISYAIKISQTIKPPYNLSDIDPELAAVLRANSDYIGSTIENTTFIKGTELDYIYNSVGDGINSITATDNNQIPDLAYSQLLTPIIRTSETINYDNANSVRSITRTFTEIISKKKQT